MSQNTKRLQLELQGAEEFYDIEKFNNNFALIDKKVMVAAKKTTADSLEMFAGSEEAQDMKNGDSVIINDNIYLFHGEEVSDENSYLPYAGKPIEERTPVYTQPAERLNIESGEKLGISFGKIRRFFADLKKVAFSGSYTDLTNKPDLSVGGLGAAASSHKHSASDVTSGILEIERGGTGAADAAKARTNLGVAASSHKHSAVDVTSGTLGIARGGTGATDAVAARTNLGAAASAHKHSAAEITTGTLKLERGGTGAVDAVTARKNIGAAASTHNHSAAEITSGTLGIARGGTGATDAASARKNLEAAASTHNHSAAEITSGTLGIARGGTGAADAAGVRTNMGLGTAAIKNVANNCTTTADGAVLDARQGKVLMDKANQINSDLNELNGSLNGKASKSADLGNCTFYQSGSDFYIRGADSVTKKLGSVPELVATVSSLRASCSYTFNASGNYLIVVSTSNDKAMPDNNISGVSASTLSEVSRGSWTGGEDACNFQHQKVYLATINARNTVYANGSGGRLYVCMSIFKL